MKDSDIWSLDDVYSFTATTLIKQACPITGLCPDGFAISSKKICSVQDSLWSAWACWSLSQAYSKRYHDTCSQHDSSRALELSLLTKKIFRGVLESFLWQKQKVLDFKFHPSKANSLSSYYYFETGEIGTKDVNGHLLGSCSMDDVALFLLLLSRLSVSNISVIFTDVEADFVQNLVYYIERAYRTPSRGLWQRGSRHNCGENELNAGTIGMCIAALRALHQCKVFGCGAGSSPFVHVDLDALFRNETTFDNLLPRFSATKRFDSALLPTVGFPGFVTDAATSARLFESISEELNTPEGFVRFSQDGQFTDLELNLFEKRLAVGDTSTVYDRTFSAACTGLETRFPFVNAFSSIYEMLNTNGSEERKHIYDKLEKDMMHSCPNCQALCLPTIVTLNAGLFGCCWRCASPLSEHHHVSPFRPSLPHFCRGYALIVVARLLAFDHLSRDDFDVPCAAAVARHPPLTVDMAPASVGCHGDGQRAPHVQLVVVSATARLRQYLRTHGVDSDTATLVAPIEVWPSWRLIELLRRAHGRPPRPLGALQLGKTFRIVVEGDERGERSGFDVIACVQGDKLQDAQMRDRRWPRHQQRRGSAGGETANFYASRDPRCAIDAVKRDLAFLRQRWPRRCARPGAAASAAAVDQLRMPIYTVVLNETDFGIDITDSVDPGVVDTVDALWQLCLKRDPEFAPSKTAAATLVGLRSIDGHGFLSASEHDDPSAFGRSFDEHHHRHSASDDCVSNAGSGANVSATLWFELLASVRYDVEGIRLTPLRQAVTRTLVERVVARPDTLLPEGDDGSSEWTHGEGGVASDDVLQDDHEQNKSRGRAFEFLTRSMDSRCGNGSQGLVPCCAMFRVKATGERACFVDVLYSIMKKDHRENILEVCDAFLLADGEELELLMSNTFSQLMKLDSRGLVMSARAVAARIAIEQTSVQNSGANEIAKSALYRQYTLALYKRCLEECGATSSPFWHCARVLSPLVGAWAESLSPALTRLVARGGQFELVDDTLVLDRALGPTDLKSALSSSLYKVDGSVGSPEAVALAQEALLATLAHTSVERCAFSLPQLTRRLTVELDGMTRCAAPSTVLRRALDYIDGEQRAVADDDPRVVYPAVHAFLRRLPSGAAVSVGGKMDGDKAPLLRRDPLTAECLPDDKHFRTVVDKLVPLGSHKRRLLLTVADVFATNHLSIAVCGDSGKDGESFVAIDLTDLTRFLADESGPDESPTKREKMFYLRTLSYVLRRCDVVSDIQ